MSLRVKRINRKGFIDFTFCYIVRFIIADLLMFLILEIKKTKS